VGEVRVPDPDVATLGVNDIALLLAAIMLSMPLIRITPLQ
jgi:hypothetical protein